MWRVANAHFVLSVLGARPPPQLMYHMLLSTQWPLWFAWQVLSPWVVALDPSHEMCFLACRRDSAVTSAADPPPPVEEAQTETAALTRKLRFPKKRSHLYQVTSASPARPFGARLHSRTAAPSSPSRRCALLNVL